MVGRRLRGKQSVEPSRPIDRNGWCLSQILRIFEWLVEYLGLQIFRLLPVAKNCRELLDTNQSNMWTRLLKDKICFNHFRAPDVMCQALSSRIPADLHNLSVCNGTCAIQRASKRSIANSWRLVVDWVRPSLKKLEMEFGQGIYLPSFKKLFRNLPDSLKELRLDFQQSRPLGPATLEQLAKKISEMSLRGLKLCLHFQETTDSVAHLLQQIPEEVDDLEISLNVHCLHHLALSKALAETFTSLSKLQKLKLSFSSNSNETYAHIHPPGHGLLSLAEICGSIPGRLKVLRMTFLACYLPKLYLEEFFNMLSQNQQDLGSLHFVVNQCRFESTPHIVLPSGLQSCKFDILSADGIDFLSICYPPSLPLLHLQWFDCHWPIESFCAMLRQLPTSLQKLDLAIDWCTLQSVQSDTCFPATLQKLWFQAVNTPFLEHRGWQRPIMQNLAHAMNRCSALGDFTMYLDESPPHHCHIDQGQEIQQWALSHLK